MGERGVGYVDDTMKLTSTNARRYRKTTTVKAFHSSNGATYRLEWGDLDYPGSHWVIVQGDEVYGVAEDSFDATYEAVPGEPDTYRKTASIWARQMDEPFELESKEGRARGKAGDWLAQQLDGEQWHIPDRVFRATYEEVEPAARAAS